MDALLRVEHNCREDDNSHREGEEEEAQLGGAALERVAEYPQTLRVSRELKDTKHTEDSQSYERSAQIFIVRNAQSDIIG